MRHWLKIGAWILYYATLALILLGCACLWALMLAPLDRLRAVSAANGPANGPAGWHDASGGNPPFSLAPEPSVLPPVPWTGLVWVNTRSQIYHFPRCRWYGTTQAGKYLSEAEAIAEGARADKTERRPEGFLQYFPDPDPHPTR